MPISPSHPSNRGKLTKQEALTLERKFFIAEIETCSDMMYRVAWSILRNDADVQDALQDAALKAWEKRDKLRDEKFFRTWITRILMATFLTCLSKNSPSFYKWRDELPGIVM